MAAPPRVERLTVADAVATYLTAVASQAARGVLARTTQRSYERDLREFARLVGGDVVLDDVSGTDIDDVLVRYQSTPDGRYRDRASSAAAQGRSPGTVNRFRQSVSRFFTHAALQGWVQANPFQWAAPPARLRGGLRTARTALSGTAARSLLEVSDGAGAAASSGAVGRADHDLGLRDRLVVALLVILGPRVSELVGADLDDFVREPGQVRWRVRGKGGGVRTLALSPALVAVFDAYVGELRPRLVDRGPGDPDARRALFITWRGRRLDAQGVRGVVARAVRRMPAEYRREATPHALRHTTATLLVANGWDVKVVAELLGHASIATTGVYLDRIEGELAAAIRAHPLADGTAWTNRSASISAAEPPLDHEAGDAVTQDS
ncbi:site-specific recombinase XerD [Sediminihabitans luteus]|uniref:Site-specific recombinase XerD n=1 Tax=Sediminihabitans luteus TaxID=1138585 RepID=A0A2M9CQT0_9CELL|nr:tyrosine-type recombinase/integrase [Sediminihabitans luteus]PJJ74249.1 site-specific recombinase XerD [Sediminihabitans luteus]GII99102.1 tyrosine recombinase XerD [Sediminihabitans luteus]